MALGGFRGALLTTRPHNVYSTPTQGHTQGSYSTLTQPPCRFPNYSRDAPAPVSRATARPNRYSKAAPRCCALEEVWVRSCGASIDVQLAGLARRIARMSDDGTCIALCAYPLACSGCTGMPLQASPAQGPTCVFWSCQTLASSAPVRLASLARDVSHHPWFLSRPIHL